MIENAQEAMNRAWRRDQRLDGACRDLNEAARCVQLLAVPGGVLHQAMADAITECKREQIRIVRSWD